MTRRRVLGVPMATAAVVGAVLAAWALVGEDSDDVRPRETWIVAEGETRTFSPTTLLPGDGFRCGGADGPGVGYVPAPGTGVGNSAGITVTAAIDGTVTVECERLGRPSDFAPPPGSTRTLTERLREQAGVFDATPHPRLQHWGDRQDAVAYESAFDLCARLGRRDLAIQLHVRDTARAVAIAVLDGYDRTVWRAAHQGCADGLMWDARNGLDTLAR
jgi:hypothetical protein